MHIKNNPDDEEEVVDDNVDDVEIVRVLDTASQQSMGNESVVIRRVDSFKSGSQMNSYREQVIRIRNDEDQGNEERKEYDDEKFT